MTGSAAPADGWVWMVWAVPAAWADLAASWGWTERAAPRVATPWAAGAAAPAAAAVDRAASAAAAVPADLAAARAAEAATVPRAVVPADGPAWPPSATGAEIRARSSTATRPSPSTTRFGTRAATPSTGRIRPNRRTPRRARP